MRSNGTGIAIAVCLLLVFAPTASAQCVVTQALVGAIGISVQNNYVGQTFVACQSGVITQITFKPGFTSANTTFAMQAGSGMAAPTLTQTITTTGFVDAVINLVPGFPVVGGNTYSFAVRRNDGSLFSALPSVSGDQYVAGTMFLMNPNFVVVGGADATFQVTVGSTVPVEDGTWGAIKALYEQ